MVDEQNLERAQQREICKRLVDMKILTAESARQLLAQQPSDFLGALEQAGIKQRLVESMMSQIAEAGYQRTIVDPIAGPNDETVAQVPGQSVSDSVDLEIDPGTTGTVDPAPLEESVHTVPPPRRPKEAPVDLEKLIKSHSFEQGRELGRGAMGVVYRAHQTDIDSNDVVIKKLINVNPNSVARFMREAKLMRLAKHPGVPSVFEIGIDPADGKPYMAMELVRGEKLTTKIDDASLGRAELLDVFVKMCDTMAYAHSQGIIHRDLKPDNIMVGQFGEAQVLDWGLAKQVDQQDIPGERKSDDPKLTQDGATPGTPIYMAPEQVYADPAEKRSDIYTLGAILYEMLTSTYIRDGSNAHEMMARAIRDEFAVKKPRKLDPTIPPELEAIVMKALEPRPEDRYQTAEDLRDDVQAFIRGDFVSAYNYGKLQRAWRKVSKHPKKLAVAATLMLAAAVGGPAFGKLSASAAMAREEAATAELGKTKAEADAQRTAKEKAELVSKQAEESSRQSVAINLLWKATDAYEDKENIETVVIPLLQEAAKTDPTWAEPNYHLGRILAYDLLQGEKALESLREANKRSIAKSQRIDLRALFTAGLVAIDILDDPKKSDEYFAEIVDKAENKEDSYVLLSQSLQAFNAKKFEKAIKLAEEVTAQRKKHDAFYLLSMYHSSGIATRFNVSGLEPYRDLNKARLYITRAIELEKNWKYYLHRSLINNVLKNVDDALDDAENALHSTKHLKGAGVQFVYYAKAQALINKAGREQNQNKLHDVLNLLDQAEKRFGELLYHNLALRGLVYLNLGEYQKAEEALSISIVQKEYNESRSWRGLVRQRQGRLEEALEDHNRAIELGMLREGFIYRAQCYEQLQNYENAANDYAKAAEQGIPFGHFHRGRLLAQLGKIEGAIASFEEYLKTGHPQFRTQAQQILDKLRQR